MKIGTEELYYILDSTPSNQNIMLCGKHGIGKSEIITNYYTNKGMKVVPLFIGQMSDPGDIIGLPHMNEETGQTEFMLPYWFPVDGKPIVLFLDELNRARPELLQVVMDLVLNKKIAGKSLPEGSIIISAINSGNEYTLTDLDPALVSRFNIYEFCPTVKEWIKWAIQNGVNECVVDFIGSNDKYLDYNFIEGDDNQIKTYDRRSWKRLSDIINYKGYDNKPSFRKMLTGIVGDSAAAKFVSFVGEGTMVKTIEIISDFNSTIDRISSYNIIHMMTLIDRFFGFCETNDIRKNVDYNTNFVKNNIILFVNYLINNNREAMSYFVSNYSSGLYPKFAMYIGMNADLDNLINGYISSIEFKA